MNSLDRLYATDEAKETEGIEWPIGLNELEKEMVLIVGAMNNPRHEKALDRYDKHLRAARNNEKKLKSIRAKIAAEGLLLGWNGILDAKKKEVKYTPELGAEMLLKYKHLYAELLIAATDHTNFQTVQEEEDTDNLKK